MGVLIDFVGLANGFYAIGVIIVGLLVLTGVWSSRQRDIGDTSR